MGHNDLLFRYSRGEKAGISTLREKIQLLLTKEHHHVVQTA